MALKIFTIIMALFVAELTFLATKKPKKLNTHKEKFVTSDIEFTNLSGGSIDTSGVKNHIHAKKAIKFATYDEMYDLNATFSDNNITHKIRAKKAIYKDQLLTFKNSVFYENNQSLRIKTQNLEYNTKTKVASSSKAFTLKTDSATVFGKEFTYDMKNGHIKAKKPHYIQEVDE